MIYENYRVTDPAVDPNDIYPEVPGINPLNFRLSGEKLTEAQRAEALSELESYETLYKSNFLGYQVNQHLEFQAPLGKYMDYHINNVGDPFIESNLKVNSKFAERAVLDYFASLWNAKWPHQNNETKITDDWTESYWGYVVSAGCTEANIFALWSARDYLAGQMTYLNGLEQTENLRRDSVFKRSRNSASATAGELPTAYTPIAFFSQDTHYSITKAMRILSIHTFNSKGSGKWECPLSYPCDYPEGYSIKHIDGNGWPTNVPSNQDGSIHVPSLVKLVKFFAEKGYPIMVNFNYGSTFKGAYDDVAGAISQLVPILQENSLYEREVEYDKENHRTDTRSGYWFHVDGALGAAYVPFYQMATKEVTPVFDFRIPEVTSMAMSGHKWLGCPMPCGIYMTRVRNQMLPPDNPNYIGSPDSTFAGSRNGLSPLVLWDYIARNSYQDFIDKVNRHLRVTRYAVEQLEALQAELGTDLWVEHTPLALTVRFKKANDEIITKYSLSGENLYIGEEERGYSHIYTMDHVTEELIDSLVADLRQEGAFPEQTSQTLAINRNLL